MSFEPLGFSLKYVADDILGYLFTIVQEVYYVNWYLQSFEMNLNGWKTSCARLNHCPLGSDFLPLILKLHGWREIW